MKNRTRWLYRLGPFVPLLVVALWSSVAFARGGGGESYNSGRSGGGGDDGVLGLIFQLLLELTIEHPCVGLPLLVLFVGGVWYFRSQQGSTATRKVLDRAEAERRTTVSAGDVTAWVNALKTKDPAFDLLAFFDRTKKLFVDVQEAWFRRNLEPVRRFLSDATYSRLATQLKILDVNGVRDAIAEMQVLDLQIIGLEQTPYFDTVHVRVRAQNRDDDAPASFTDEQARALAQKKSPEQFVEVWSFVRKPGAQTKAAELSTGNCPNCGAPFQGGAANTCEFCKAIVNSGNYDWVLAEITQGSEYAASHQTVEGIARARQQDPGLNTEMLEDRASLCFWKWIDAQVIGDASVLSKIAGTDFAGRMKGDIDGLKAQNRRKVFLECAVGAVNTRAITQADGYDLAHVEIRWSARMGIGPAGEKAPSLPSVPQRWVFILQRKSGAQTPIGNGMSTSRCLTCGAPLSDNGAVSCEFCGSMLASGEKDWVIRDISSWETWQITAAQQQRAQPQQPQRLADRVPDREERERLMYLMAAMAAADGVVDQRERQLLKMCSDRWSVPWANVELALGAGPGLFERLIAKGSGEAESLLRQLIQMALVDGKIDRKERKLLEQAATHLGLGEKLPAMLRQ